jgi:hypothetical protein
MNRSASSFSSILFRLSLQGLLLAVMVGALGCSKGGSGPKNAVSGKVTLGGKPVAGEVIFVGSGNKEVKALIATDGTYSVTDPAPGDNDVLVKSMLLGGTAPPKDMMKDMKAPVGTGGTPAPAKYAQRGNGLKFTVTTGQQKYDIELTP